MKNEQRKMNGEQLKIRTDKIDEGFLVLNEDIKYKSATQQKIFEVVKPIPKIACKV